MKNLLLIVFLFLTVDVLAQGKIEPTDQFTVEGKVRNRLIISLKNLNAFTSHSIDSVVIYNHLMKLKKTIKEIKGVMLTEILDKPEIDVSLKLLSEVYITCIASDNYKVVFSWNEVYNSAVGEKVMIMTEANGKKGNQIPDRIVLLSAADRATGRRYVEGLQTIVIEQVK